MRAKRFINEIVRPIIVVIIGTIFYHLGTGIIMSLCSYYEIVVPFYLWKIDVINNITEAQAEKYLKEMVSGFTILRLGIIPSSMSVITGFIVGLLSHKKAWLLGGIVIFPSVIICIIPWIFEGIYLDFDSISTEIETMFYFSLLPLFLCSLSSHLSYKLKIWSINKIKEKIKGGDKN